MIACNFNRNSYQIGLTFEELLREIDQLVELAEIDFESEEITLAPHLDASSNRLSIEGESYNP